MKTSLTDYKRILEIGEHSLIKRVWPNQTEFVFTGSSEQLKFLDGLTARPIGVKSIQSLFRDIRKGKFDLIVVHAPCYAPWEFSRIKQYFGSRTLGHIARSFIPFLIRPTATPLIVLDMEDQPLIYPHNFKLLDRCNAYFKRELPTDHLRLFARTHHPYTPTAREREQNKMTARLAKLHPISLGLSAERIAQIPANNIQKENDLFFSGQLEGWSIVRERGFREIEELMRLGYKVDFPTSRLTLNEFMDRCARSRLVWSPEGLGWDCFRHYEAAACRSVPLISQPTIQRYQPLIDGVHCYYYGVEPGGLIRVAETALKDHEKLQNMGNAAHQHVIRHFTHEQICSYIIETVHHIQFTKSKN